ncbi:MAG: hypothetical protein DCF25_02270 [Leptolyngbya foveolarum]|uniref:DUF6602 domain-containing protein n=1 Tax=Leptolyngbya foveolarum TaxID=47253 RepID=A0A2W4V0I5_9CYAN|nr:MAG: hypothetical protein DCF25_02270 [Leptolyngbya foveolarum]
MTGYSLSTVLESLHDDIQQKLSIARKSFTHPGTKGDASESVWLELLQTYLPQRYEAARAHVVDSNGRFSDQIDVVVFDRQYSPFIFRFNEQNIIPAESVYAVFEAKQSADSQQINYAMQKVSSVRQLLRTSLPIPHAGGTYPPKPLNPIYGGILAFESEWSPPMGDSLLRNLHGGDSDSQLDMGCIAAHGCFNLNKLEDAYEIYTGNKAATSFLFDLITKLQCCGTVPMIDIQAYAKWLNV